MSRWLIVSIGLTLAGLAASLYVGLVRPDLLPAQVPTHWNAYGHADAWAPRDQALPSLLLLPAVMAFLVLLTPLLPMLSPHSFEVDRFRRTYDYLMMLVTALMAYMQGSLLLAVTGVVADVGRAFMAGTFLFFALFGNMLGKVQRNFWMGIRTPWTLASETVWNRTHRLAAYLWLVGGLLGLVAVLAGLSSLPGLAVLLVLVLIPVFYSLYLYKLLDRQGKLPEAATTPHEP